MHACIHSLTHSTLLFHFHRFYTIILGVSVAEHDWHHEKFLANYSLSFKYLDKIFGTYHPGREPGTGKEVLVTSENNKNQQKRDEDN